MFQLLVNHGLAINLEKRELAVGELDFLGDCLRAASSTPLTGSLLVMYELHRPHTIKDL
jgi:hypothetical protein